MARNSSSAMRCLSGSNPRGASKHGGGATCVDVMHDTVERFGGRCLGAAATGIPRVVVEPVAGAR
jgi:hypothetical protein